uniref:Ig-like domain-containing protein n=1 Tax=Fundulus heteroclitus TaxID=8078 RepID=A0A3Q2P2Y0_FUNHE
HRRARAALPPSFTLPLVNQEVTEGNVVTLHCELSKPAPSVEWRKGGELLKNGDKYQMRKKDLRVEMKIADDGGVYTCEAVNKFGVTSYNGNITVTEAGHFTRLLIDCQELIKNKAKSGQSCYLLEDAFSVVSCLPWRSDNLHRVSLIENYPAPLTALGEPVRQVREKNIHVFILCF